MSNIMDYLAWRGDLSFEASPFNEVDNLILSELAYIDFSGIVTGRGKRLADAAEEYFAEGREEKLAQTALFQAGALGPMLDLLARSPRFSEAWLFCLEQRRDLARETQFAAISVDLGTAGVYLAFSGTDDSLVGWKEDFNMSFMDSVPSQPMACDYLARVAAERPERTLMLGGHSKGGNLAVYAALHAGPALTMRITAVYNNDGPGFRESQLHGPAYEALKERIHTIVPQSSIIGMLLEHDEDYRVVRSTQKGILQHDAFSWQVERDGFVELSGSAIELELNEKTLKKAIGGMNRSQLEEFTDAVFEILTTGGVQTTTEIKDEGLFRSLSAMSKTYAELSSETRKLVHETLSMLVSDRVEARVELWLKEVQGSSLAAALGTVWGQLKGLVHRHLPAAEEEKAENEAEEEKAKDSEPT